MPIIPLELGGNDVPTNYAPICEDCLNMIQEAKANKLHKKNEAIVKGLQKAKKKGKTLGRPTISHEDIPEEVKGLFLEYQWGYCTKADIIRKTGLSRPTIYKYIDILQKGGK